MAAQEIKPLTQLHWDGKVLKNTRVSDDAPPRQKTCSLSVPADTIS